MNRQAHAYTYIYIRNIAWRSEGGWIRGGVPGETGGERGRGDGVDKGEGKEEGVVLGRFVQEQKR